MRRARAKQSKHDLSDLARQAVNSIVYSQAKSNARSMNRYVGALLPESQETLIAKVVLELILNSALCRAYESEVAQVES